MQYEVGRALFRFRMAASELSNCDEKDHSVTLVAGCSFLAIGYQALVSLFVPDRSAQQLNPAHFRVILNGSDLRFPEQAGSLA